MPPPRPPLRPDDAKLAVLREGQEGLLRDVVARCARAPRYSFDTETSLINDWDLDVVGWNRETGARSVGYVLSWAPGVGVYVPFDHRNGLEGRWPGQLDFEVVRDLCRPLLEGHLGGEQTVFNGPFDYRISLKDDLVLAITHDASILVKLLSWATGRWDPRGSEDGESRRSLKNITEELIGIITKHFSDFGPPASPVKGKKKPPPIDYSSLNPFDPAVYRYAAADGSNTLRVMDPLLRMAEAEGILQSYNIECALIPAVSEMRHHGVLIDADLALAKATEGRVVATKLESDYMTTVSEVMGREVKIDLDSPKQLAGLLFNAPPDGLGLPPVHFSEKTKQPSTDKETLRVLARQFPVVKSIQTFRGITKNLGTYLEGYPKRIHPVTGRIHANFNPLTQSTGRFNSTNPNLQNMTLEGLQFDLEGGARYTANVRDIVIATPGWYWLDYDFSQVEYRALAGEAQEMGLINGWRRDALMDVHAMTAALIFGCPLEEVTKLQRQRGKTMNFAIVYGRGAEAVAEDLGIPISEAQKFLEEYYARLPAIRRWQEEVKIEARRHGYVITKFGWKRALPEYLHPAQGIRTKGDRLAVNTKIQGVCAQILKIAMVRLRNRILAADLQDDVRIVLTVHDSIGLEVRESLEPDALHDLCRSALIWEIPGWPPLEVDAKIGFRYGSLIDYHGEARVDIAWPDRVAVSEPPPPEEVDSSIDGDESLSDGPEDRGVPAGVLLEVPGLTAPQAAGLLALVAASPGPHPVRVVVNGQSIPMALSTSEGPESPEWVRAIGPCRVRWDVDEASVLAEVKV